jgi:uncharacterized protein (TIGR04552 family)
VLRPLDQFSLSDLEAVRILLRGDSVIDWHRLNFETDEAISQFLRAQDLDLSHPIDRDRAHAVRDAAISYLRRHFAYPIPKPVASASIEELVRLASSQGHRQTCACTILKCMHIIHHLDGRELLFMLPLSNQEVFGLVEEKVYRVIGQMLADHHPITEFVGGRKLRDSLYTKLLSKQETIASQVYDKLRFRIVTRDPSSLLPVLRHLTQELFPFNYVIPGQSINSLINFRETCQAVTSLRRMERHLQAGKDAEFTPSDNVFSADNYRVVHFVVDVPVRVPDEVLARAPSAARGLGRVVFVIVEFQVIDQATEASNELGDASHAKYKERQKKAVMRRLQLGMRESMRPLDEDELDGTEPSGGDGRSEPGESSDERPSGERPKQGIDLAAAAGAQPSGRSNKP